MPRPVRTMSLADACDLVPDDLPDGAYWAMAHEIAGAEFGEAWDELPEHPEHKDKPHLWTKPHQCPICKRRFKTKPALEQHRRDAHARRQS